ncbi:MAG: SDR family NAD(P)-dependent oxidoreductase, partial [Clostridia bacterium]|nr:SDR family NAD(P)-dependent oxidoreductase [Clostridia bacterium]
MGPPHFELALNADLYASAKWGVLGFSKGLYTELQPYNIRVCCAIPAGCGTTNFDRSANLPE